MIGFEVLLSSLFLVMPVILSMEVKEDERNSPKEDNPWLPDLRGILFGDPRGQIVAEFTVVSSAEQEENRRVDDSLKNVFVDGEDYNKKKRKSYADCEDPGARATLYAGGAFDGERLSLHSSAPRIGLFGFPSASVRVSGSCCWELFERVGFTGNMVRLCPGNYSESMLSGSISRGIKSVKAVRYHMV